MNAGRTGKEKKSVYITEQNTQTVEKPSHQHLGRYLFTSTQHTTTTKKEKINKYLAKLKKRTKNVKRK